MAYYQNGQGYYQNNSAQSQQPPPSQYQNPYDRRTPGYDNEDEGAARANGGANNNYGYPGMPVPVRRNSIALRQNDELFIGDNTTPMTPPAPNSPGLGGYSAYQYQVQSQPAQNQYQPQYSTPIPQPNPQTFGGVNRTSIATSHQPYNPALYAQTNLGRTSTVSHLYGFSPSTPSSASYPTPPQQPYPSPPLQSQAQFGRTYSVQDHRQHSPQSGYSAQPGSAPGRPAYSRPPPPPLPVPPGSATSPTADWGGVPSRHPSAAPSYQPYNHVSNSDLSRQNTLPSPPTYQPGHSSQGRMERYPSNSSHHSSNPLPPTPEAPPHRSPPRTDTVGRRPLPPPPPPESDSETDYFSQPNGNSFVNQDELFDQIENTFNAPGGSPGAHPSIHVNQRPINGGEPQLSYYGTLDRHGSGHRNGGAINGDHLAPYNPPENYNTSDESDIEAAAGLAALQMAEAQEEADEARRRSGGTGLFSTYTSIQPAQQYSNLEAGQGEPASASDSDYVPVDVGLYGGNYEPHFSYGGGPNQLAAVSGSLDNRSQPVSSSGSQRRSEAASDADAYDYPTDIHPFPPFSANARVDTFGTGGLAEPSALRRRLSYDEGDEVTLTDTQSPVAGEPPDMFYHPGMSVRRPLPPPPAGDRRYHHSTGSYNSDWRYQQSSRQSYPSAPESLQSPGGALVPRSTSLLSHTNPPQAIPLPRSKTDAEQPKARQQQASRNPALYGIDSDGNTLTPASSDAVALDLPALPAGKRFNPAKLTPNDFKKCAEPWALSSIISWLKAMAEGEADLKEHTISEGLVALFTHKVPTMNVADAETLSSRVVSEMYKVGTLVHDEEWLKFSSETMTGVIYQLTGHGCYAPKLHNYSTPGRCYALHCQRTLKKIDLQSQPAAPRSDDWATYYKVKKEDIEGVDKKEIERQNILHEIVQGEDKFMENLDVLRLLYRDKLLSAQPPVIPPKMLKSFIRDVFGKVDAVKKANEEYLLPQMKYRQHEQGPWVVGFSDIFREWIRKAKQAYIEYAAAFPYATFLVRQEADKNMLFRAFLDETRSNKMSNKLSWDTFLKAPITRLQHYGLLLGTVLKRTTLDNEEKRNLQIAMEEIKVVTLECDTRVAEMSRKVDLTDLDAKLILRPGMQRVELNLNHLGRELIFKGDLQRMGGNRFTWLETHALLFDHYLVLAKTVTQRDGDGGTKSEKYDVSRLPIPMDLLVLESEDDDPVVKSAVKGIASVTTVSGKTSAQDSRLARTASNQSPGPGSLTHTNTSTSLTSMNTTSSGKTMVNTTVVDPPKDERILYPFRIKHLGKEVYTLFAPTLSNRQEWCDKLIIAKTKHASALFAQNAEPFRLRVMADAAFAYESAMPAQKSITIKGTPLDRAIEEVEKLFANSGRPVPICRARVNCATTFSQPYGKQMIAIGTDIGVYISEMDNPRGWSKAIQIHKVTQVAVLEEFGLMLLISDKSLIAYHLDAVCPVGGVPPANDSTRRAPQKLSGARDVGFFATGKMKDRTLVFYKKREGISSTFKVLEPVYQKSTEKKSRIWKQGRTEFFRDYDEFYIPTECFGINLFHSSLAVSTSKGFEVLTLDKKQPWSVPDLKQPHVATIASRLVGQDPLGMFRLSDQEFLLCYEECAVYVNKHGDISRSVIMEFVGKAKSAALYGPYVLLFDPDFVEIRNAQNGRLRQVIAGRDVKCLDDGLSGGSSGNRTVKLSLQHPEQERCQIVVELLLNEGQKE
ncbi:hypothetical protein K432DRAFT_402862 [Lepidopterella palustris CBS 459.81]|uniref:Uncharacterized protein n=1 Tax=Lepidopterella palustris CBS 459.81 TaxID=1314670 RepID=A0A8E2EED9_9PEZI|nr:hypothetical protein K432DRAFT_402862 [Lepidopterella palustris CBS 459.81]